MLINQLMKLLVHAGIHNKTEVEIKYYDSEQISKMAVKNFKPDGSIDPWGLWR